MEENRKPIRSIRNYLLLAWYKKFSNVFFDAVIQTLQDNLLVAWFGF